MFAMVTIMDEIFSSVQLLGEENYWEWALAIKGTSTGAGSTILNPPSSILSRRNCQLTKLCLLKLHAVDLMEAEIKA